MKNATAINACIGLGLLLLAGYAFLSQPYCLWAGRCFVVLLAGSVAFSVSTTSNTPTAELVRNVAITCLGIGGFCFVTYGSETRDDIGGIVSEGFEAGFNEKAGAGVRAFAALFVGALAGVLLADRQKQTKRDGE